jgi:hypothetical protein
MGYFVADTGVSTGNVIIGTDSITVASNITVGQNLVVGNIFAANILTSAGIPYIGTQQKVLYQPGTLIATVGKARWYPPSTISINQIRAIMVVPPVGRSANVNVNKNGSLVTSLGVPANSNAFAYSNVTVSVTPADYITVDVVQAGNISPGSDLHVLFYY